MYVLFPWSGSCVYAPLRQNRIRRFLVVLLLRRRIWRLLSVMIQFLGAKTLPSRHLRLWYRLLCTLFCPYMCGLNCEVEIP